MHSHLCEHENSRNQGGGGGGSTLHLGPYLICIMAADGFADHIWPMMQLPVGEIPPGRSPPEGFAYLLAPSLHAVPVSGLQGV